MQRLTVNTTEEKEEISFNCHIFYNFQRHNYFRDKSIIREEKDVLRVHYTYL